MASNMRISFIIQNDLIMKKIVVLTCLIFLLFPVLLAAKPLDPKIAHSIQVTDLIIKGNLYDFRECGAYVCNVISIDGSTSLKLVRSNILESRDNDTSLRLKIFIKGSVLNADVSLKYLQDKKTIKIYSKSNGQHTVTLELDPVIFKVLVGWTEWMMEKDHG